MNHVLSGWPAQSQDWLFCHTVGANVHLMIPDEDQNDVVHNTRMPGHLTFFGDGSLQKKHISNTEQIRAQGRMNQQPFPQ